MDDSVTLQPHNLTARCSLQTAHDTSDPPERYSMETSQFHHQQLDTSKQQIRLLKVHDDKDDPVRCSPESFDLNTVPAYTALSYMWGTSGPVRHVLIGEEKTSLNIRPNLHRFLLNMRREGSCSLWIDQITSRHNIHTSGGVQWQTLR